MEYEALLSRSRKRTPRRPPRTRRVGQIRPTENEETTSSVAPPSKLPAHEMSFGNVGKKNTQSAGESSDQTEREFFHSRQENDQKHEENEIKLVQTETKKKGKGSISSVDTYRDLLARSRRRKIQRPRNRPRRKETDDSTDSLPAPPQPPAHKAGAPVVDLKGKQQESLILAPPSRIENQISAPASPVPDLIDSVQSFDSSLSSHNPSQNDTTLEKGTIPNMQLIERTPGESSSDDSDDEYSDLPDGAFPSGAFPVPQSEEKTDAIEETEDLDQKPHEDPNVNESTLERTDIPEEANTERDSIQKIQEHYQKPRHEVRASLLKFQADMETKMNVIEKNLKNKIEWSQDSSDDESLDEEETAEFGDSKMSLLETKWSQEDSSDSSSDEEEIVELDESKMTLMSEEEEIVELGDSKMTIMSDAEVAIEPDDMEAKEDVIVGSLLKDEIELTSNEFIEEEEEKQPIAEGQLFTEEEDNAQGGNDEAANLVQDPWNVFESQEQDTLKPVHDPFTGVDGAWKDFEDEVEEEMSKWKASPREDVHKDIGDDVPEELDLIKPIIPSKVDSINIESDVVISKPTKDTSKAKEETPTIQIQELDLELLNKALDQSIDKESKSLVDDEEDASSLVPTSRLEVREEDNSAHSSIAQSENVIDSSKHKSAEESYKEEFQIMTGQIEGGQEVDGYRFFCLQLFVRHKAGEDLTKDELDLLDNFQNEDRQKKKIVGALPASEDFEKEHETSSEESRPKSEAEIDLADDKQDIDEQPPLSVQKEHESSSEESRSKSEAEIDSADDKQDVDGQALLSMLPERGNKDSKMVKDRRQVNTEIEKEEEVEAEDLDETNDSDESSKSDNSSSNGTSSSKSSSESSSSEELRPPSTVLLSEEKVHSPSKGSDSSISSSSHSRSSSGPGTISESSKSSGIEEAEPDVVSISKNNEEAELAHSSSASLSDSSASDDYGFQVDAKLLSTSDTEDEYGFSSQLLNEDEKRISVEEAEGEDRDTENMGGLFHNSGTGRSTPTFILPPKSEEGETNQYDKYKNYLSSHTTPEKMWARDFVFKQKTPEKVEDLIDQVGSKDEDSDFEGSNESERVEDPRDSLDNESDSKADDVLASSSGNKASDDVEQVRNDDIYRKREKSNPALIKYLDGAAEDNLARAMFVDDKNISKESTGEPKPSTWVLPSPPTKSIISENYDTNIRTKSVVGKESQIEMDVQDESRIENPQFPKDIPSTEIKSTAKSTLEAKIDQRKKELEDIRERRKKLEEKRNAAKIVAAEALVKMETMIHQSDAPSEETPTPILHESVNSLYSDISDVENQLKKQVLGGQDKERKRRGPLVEGKLEDALLQRSYSQTSSEDEYGFSRVKSSEEEKAEKKIIDVSSESTGKNKQMAAILASSAIQKRERLVHHEAVPVSREFKGTLEEKVQLRPVSPQKSEMRKDATLEGKEQGAKRMVELRPVKKSLFSDRKVKDESKSNFQESVQNHESTKATQNTAEGKKAVTFLLAPSPDKKVEVYPNSESSLNSNGLDSILDDGTPDCVTSTWRHSVRGVLCMLILLAIGLPIFLLRFPDSNVPQADLPPLDLFPSIEVVEQRESHPNIFQHKPSLRRRVQRRDTTQTFR